MGSDVHSNKEYGLLLALEQGALELSEFLISKGADLSVIGEKAMPTLIKQSDLDGVKFLLSKKVPLPAEIQFDSQIEKSQFRVLHHLLKESYDVVGLLRERDIKLIEEHQKFCADEECKCM